MTANDGKIYLIGGGLGSGPDMRVSQLLAYDPPTDTWTSKAPVPLAAGISAYGSAIQYDGYIFVFGGITNAGADSTVLQSTLIYSIAADQWYFGTNLPEPRFGSAVGLIYGYVVVAGGGSSVIETTTWIYNTAADTYSEFQPAPMPDGFPTYRIHGVGFNDRGAGGQVHAFAGAFDGNLHFVFDVTTNMWSLGPAMPFGVTDPGVCTDGGARIFVTGGPTGQQGRLQTYNLDSRTWSQGPMMGVPVNNTACAYSGGSVYSLGGYSSALMRSIPDTFVIPVP